MTQLPSRAPSREGAYGWAGKRVRTEAEPVAHERPSRQIRNHHRDEPQGLVESAGSRWAREQAGACCLTRRARKPQA